MAFDNPGIAYDNLRAAQRSADALERIAAALERLAEPEPDDEQRSDEPDPEPPIDEWRPVKGGRAVLREGRGARTRQLAVVVDRIFESESETWAVIVDESGRDAVVVASTLRPPRGAA